MKLKINLNADVAEGYGRWTMGNDKDIINEINSANIACGMKPIFFNLYEQIGIKMVEFLEIFITCQLS